MNFRYIPDEYDWRARAVPALAVFAPALIAIVLLGTPWNPILKGATLAASLSACTFILTLIGGIPGKAMERRLWDQQGGPPTIRFLRHDNSEYNRFTRRQVHDKLSELRLPVPTAHQAAKNPQTATEMWQACVNELIRRTRDKKTFPLVFQNLAAYGLHRNLLGLKWVGIITSALSAAGGIWYIYQAINTGASPTQAVMTTILTAAFLFFWTLIPTRRNLRTSDERYARSLLEAALQLEKA